MKPGEKFWLRQFQHPLGRPAHDGAIAGHGDRSLDQLRMLDHCRDQLIAGQRLIVEFEFLEYFFAMPHEIARRHIQLAENRIELLR